jgi:hypothetical protein
MHLNDSIFLKKICINFTFFCNTIVNKVWVQVIFNGVIWGNKAKWINLIEI